MISNSSQERYVNIQENIYGYDGDKVELEVDSHELPFKLTLPKNIPSSFEASDGSVRYYLEATIDRPLAVDATSTRFFTVVSPVDLNMNPQAQIGIDAENEKALYTCCFNNGQLSATVTLPR